jgi:hypothetical protein
MSVRKTHSLSTDDLNLAAAPAAPDTQDTPCGGDTRRNNAMDGAAYKFPMTCDQIAIIPTNKTIDVSAAASCITVRNMVLSLERIKNIVHLLF